MVSKYSIKDLEKLAGIKAHTLRAWEQRYDLISPQRTTTNIRYYQDDDLKRILNVSVLVKNGMRISEVAAMKDHEVHDAVLEIGRYKGAYDSHINALKLAMLEFDEYMFESAFNQCVTKFGLEETFTKVFSKFMEEVGLFWQVGAINISNEHFISNIIRQKLFSTIDQTHMARGSYENSYILYLPSDELHEIGLLYLYYYLRSLGNRVIYLGQNVPLECVKQAAEKTDIHNFVSIFTTNPVEGEINTYLDNLAEMFQPGEDNFYFSGLQLTNYPVSDLPENILYSKDLAELKENISANTFQSGRN